MRILSKWHDFYDKGMGLSYSDDILFIRAKSHLLKEEQAKWPELNRFPYLTSRYHEDFYAFSIGLCGKIYNGIRTTYKTKAIDGTPLYLDNFYYSLDALVETFESRYEKKFNIKDFTEGVYWGWNNRSSIKDFLSKQAIDIPEFRQRCIDQQVSIIVHTSFESEDTQWTINRQLKDLQFYRILSPYIVYGELEMWLASALITPEKPMVRISDKDKIHKRGFNKWSFRKEPKK